MGLWLRGGAAFSSTLAPPWRHPAAASSTWLFPSAPAGWSTASTGRYSKSLLIVRTEDRCERHDPQVVVSLCVLSFTPEQMYTVVANVDEYQHFVPWCKKSRMMTGPNGAMRAQLEIGFPPITEQYTSELTFEPNHQIRVSSSPATSMKSTAPLPVQSLCSEIVSLKETLGACPFLSSSSDIDSV